MKLTVLFLGLSLAFSVHAAKPAEEIRGRIGSVFAAPVKVGEKFYFVATTGVLYEGNKDFSVATKLFEGKRQALGNLIHHDGKIIWGDGVHEDKKSTLHIFDLKTRKLQKAIEVEGHIERPVLVQDKVIFLPAGPGGIAAVDGSAMKLIWQTRTHEGKPLHVDSNLVSVGNKICGTTLYDLKGVICLDAANGKVLQMGALKRDPKSEITVWKNHIVGFATEADLMKTKFDIPADFYVYDVAGNTMKHNKELRGFNFFAPHVTGDDAFITLSTGDFILYNLESGKIEFLGEFPEPFVNNPFMREKNYCAIGIMGKFMCYLKAKSGYALETDKRLMETVVGKISLDGNRVIAPTRIGYYTE